MTATCKDCIHCEACERMISDTSKMFKVLLSEILKMNCDIKYDSTNILSGAEICQCFQDRARFVELPCKVGDTIYWNLLGKPVEDEIVSITIYKNVIRVFLKEGISFDIEDIGRMLFLSREEAEQAPKEREGQ